MRKLGDFIRLRAIRVGLPKVESLIQRTRRSKQTIYNFIKADTADDVSSQHFDSREAVASALQFDEWAKLVEAWKIDDYGADLPGDDGLEQVPSPTVPEWDLDVSANAWTYAPVCELDTNDPEQRKVIETGRFRLRILGTCMEPDYASGSSIEFQIVRVDKEGLVENADYVVCRIDNVATFKRLVGWDDENISLAAVNQKDYPGTTKVPRQEICRMAKVAIRLMPPLDPAPLKIRKAK